MVMEAETNGEAIVTPGEVLGKSTEVKAGRGSYLAKHNGVVYASLTGFVRTVSPSPDSTDQVPRILLLLCFCRTSNSVCTCACVNGKQ